MRRLALFALAAAGCAGTPQAAPVQAQQNSLDGVESHCAATGELQPLGATGDVQVVELWATWCAPCVKSLPLWSELARREQLTILAVSIDDERQAPVEFARDHGIDLPIFWDPFAQRLSKAVRLGGVVPTTLVVDCEGKVRHHHEGFQGAADVERVAAEVRALRQESSCTGERALPRCAHE